MKVTPFDTAYGATVNCSYNDIINNASEIKQLIFNHLVVSIPDIEMSSDMYSSLASAFGNHVRHPKTVSSHVEGHPTIFKVVSDPTKGFVPSTKMWHADGSWMQEYPQFTFFYSLIVPSQGGVTSFCDTAWAYDDLPQDVKTFINDKVALHIHTKNIKPENYPTDEECAIVNTKLDATHPLVMLHWATNRPVIYDPMAHCENLVGLTDAESIEILEYIKNHITNDRYRYDHHYKKNELVIWDNVRLIHQGSGTPPDCDRLLWQIRVRDPIVMPNFN